VSISNTPPLKYHLDVLIPQDVTELGYFRGCNETMVVALLRAHVVKDIGALFVQIYAHFSS
jgi:hypothetical protein